MERQRHARDNAVRQRCYFCHALQWSILLFWRRWPSFCCPLPFLFLKKSRPSSPQQNNRTPPLMLHGGWEIFKPGYSLACTIFEHDFECWMWWWWWFCALFGLNGLCRVLLWWNNTHRKQWIILCWQTRCILTSLCYNHGQGWPCVGEMAQEEHGPSAEPQSGICCYSTEERLGVIVSPRSFWSWVQELKVCHESNLIDCKALKVSAILFSTAVYGICIWKKWWRLSGK